MDRWADGQTYGKWQMKGQINEQKNEIGQDCGQNNVQMETRGTYNLR